MQEHAFAVRSVMRSTENLRRSTCVIVGIAAKTQGRPMQPTFSRRMPSSPGTPARRSCGYFGCRAHATPRRSAPRVGLPCRMRQRALSRCRQVAWTLRWPFHLKRACSSPAEQRGMRIWQACPHFPGCRPHRAAPNSSSKPTLGDAVVFSDALSASGRSTRPKASSR